MTTVTLRKRYVDLDAGQIHYAVRDGAGLPIVFFHQTASTWEMWKKVIAGLDSDVPVYAFDTPGFGGSFDPDGMPAMGDYANWLGDACAAIGIELAHLVGHHTGAAIAAELAASRPALAASVSLIGPLSMTAEERAEAAEHYGRPFLPTPSGGYLLDNWDYLRAGGATADLMVAHREMFSMLRAYASRPQAYGAVWGQDFDAALLAIRCPLQLLCAPDDVLWPYFGAARALRPDAVAVELSGGASFGPDLVAVDIAAAISAHIERAALAPKDPA